MPLFFLGFLTMGLTSLMLNYILFRRKEMLLAILVVCVIASGFLVIRSRTGFSFSPGKEILVVNYIGFYLLTLGQASQSWFIRILVSSKDNHPRFNRILRLFELISICFFPSLLILASLFLPPGMILSLLRVMYLYITVVIVYVLYFLFRSGNTEFRLVATGITFWVLCFRVDLMPFVFGNSKTIPSMSLAEVGLSMYVFMLNVALARRSWLVLLEKGRIELERQRDLIRQRKNISNDLHDDVGSALGSLPIFVDMAERNIETDPMRAKRYLDRLRLGLLRTSENVSDAVWAINNEVVTDRLFSMRVMDLFLDVFEANGIQAEYRIDAELESRIKRMEVRKNLMSFVRETINNVIRHSGADKVAIVLEKIDDKLSLSVMDNGRGIPDSPKQGHGLSSLRSRTHELGGEFLLEPLGQGIRVTCLVPIANISD